MSCDLSPNRKLFAVIVIALVAFVSRPSFASTSLKISSTSINFGSWPVGGGGHAMYETLTNNGTSTVTVTHYYISGQFTTFNIYYPLTLKPGARFTFKVKYVPTSAGTATGKLTITSNAPTITVALSGTGTSTATSTPTLSPTTYGFGNVTVGTTASLTATLKAGSSSVSISKATTTNPEFTLSGLTLPTTLAAGQSMSIKVNFKPTASGSTSSSISITAGTKTLTASATGAGVATTQHKVNLSWSPSTSSGVAGYNIYRGTATGGPYTKLNSSSLVSTSYTDATVSSGKTYFYVTTSVGSSGTESAKSNEAKAAVPTP